MRPGKTKSNRAVARSLRRRGLSAAEIASRIGTAIKDIDSWISDIKIVPDVEFLPADSYVVDRALEIVRIGKHDILYELGCGNATLAIRAAKRFRIKCVGIDVDPNRLKESRAAAAAAGVSDLVRIRHCDWNCVDLSAATIVVMYINPDEIIKIVPVLHRVPQGGQIVSINYPIKGFFFKEYLAISPRDHGTHPDYIYLYTTPLMQIADDACCNGAGSSSENLA